MTAIVWDQIGDRVFETGVDRGVLYFPAGGGVAWNGLTSVTPNIDNTVESVYYDGIKMNDIVTVGDFKANLKAYTYPDEFLEYEGTEEAQSGFFVTGQGPKFFHLSWRSSVGDDIEGIALGYKIHLLWNALAIPSTRTYDTLSDSPSALQFEWNITAIPEYPDRWRPTPYLIIDSRQVSAPLLAELELILYGTTGIDPKMPTIDEVLTIS